MEQSFAEVLESLRNPPNSLRREARIVRRTAVVLAILDVVEADPQHSSEPASKIYAQCVTALEGTLTTNETTGTQIALLEVLSFVLPHVDPPAILSATLPLTSRILRALVALGDESYAMKDDNDDDKTGGSNALLRWVARVASILLLRLPSSKVDEKEVKQLLNVTLLNLFNDRRPKVRKAAHNHVIEMLSSTDEECPRVVLSTISSFCHQQLAEPLEEISAHLATGNMDWFQKSSHLFAFLERAIVYLNFSKITEDVMGLISALLMVPKNQTGSEHFIAATKIKQNTPRILAISSLTSIMLVMLQDENQNRKNAIDALAPRILASILRGQTTVILNEDAAEFDVLDKARIVCGQVVLHSCNRSLHAADAKQAAVKLMPLAIQFIRTMCLPSVDGDVSVAQTLMVELSQFLRMVLPQLRTETSCLSDTMKTLQTIVQEPKYRATWPVSLKCITILLPFLHSQASSSQVFESLVAAHSGKASPASKAAIKEAISTLVQQVGIEATWQWIQWHPTSPKGGVATDRAWLLTTLKNSAMVADAGSKRLDFFQSTVMTLARICDQLAATRPPSERNFHRTCVVRLWELFPCFCESPADVEEIFPSLAETLCKALGDTRYPELLISICNGLSILVKSTEAAGSFELDVSSGAAQAICTATMKLLPTMFKLVSDAHSTGLAPSDGNEETETANQMNDRFQKLQHVTEAIASISRLAPSDFLQGMFKKVMQKLLEQFQLESGETDRICSLLTLAQALVASEVLDESSVSFLYRALKPLIKDGEQEARVQKRAYKVLLQICERYHSFVTTSGRFPEICELLTATMSNAQISARYMRLRCMNAIVKDMDPKKGDLIILKGVVPEILLCLKDSNGKTRDAAYQLLLTTAASGSIIDYINTILAGLGAETIHMRSAVVLALSRIVFEYGRKDNEVQDMLPQLVQTVLLLLGEGTRETVKSVVGFLRICVSAIPPDRLEPLVPELLRTLMKSQLAKNRFRAKVKIIVKKLVKLYGYDELARYFPQSETRLLTHMRKLDEREKRRKQQAHLEANGDGQDDFEGMLDSDEEDSDDGRTLMTGATGLTRKSKLSLLKSQATRDTKAATRASAFSKADNAGVRIPDNENGEVVDMLGKKMAYKVRFAPEDDSDDDDSMGDAMEFNDDGKLVVRDDADMEDEEDKDNIHVKSARNQRGRDDNSRRGAQSTDKKRKRGRDLGAAYKSKKAGGDVKRKDQKYEPYAFVPLDGRAFSKKNRRSAVEQMSTVVRGKGKKGKR